MHCKLRPMHCKLTLTNNYDIVHYRPKFESGACDVITSSCLQKSGKQRNEICRPTRTHYQCIDSVADISFRRTKNKKKALFLPNVLASHFRLCSSHHYLICSSDTQRFREVKG